MNDKPALLALEDGAVFPGRAAGADGEVAGEVVFNTAMTGYQEILTDPSYAGQLVCLTYPLIGNYGVNEDDPESRQPWTRGLIVRELAARHSNWRATGDLGSYLKQHAIVGIDEVDTRALTRHLRLHGAKTGVISTTDLDAASLIAKARQAPKLGQLDLNLGRVGARVAGEYVEDETAAVEGSHAGELFDVAHLSRRQIVVEDDQVGAATPSQKFELGCLAFTDIVRGVNFLSGLEHALARKQGGGGGQTGQFVERILRFPDGDVGQSHTNEQGALPPPGMGRYAQLLSPLRAKTQGKELYADNITPIFALVKKTPARERPA